VTDEKVSVPMTLSERGFQGHCTVTSYKSNISKTRDKVTIEH